MCDLDVCDISHTCTYIHAYSIGSVPLENPNTPTLPPGSQKIQLETRYFRTLTDPIVQAEPFCRCLHLRVWEHLKDIKFSLASGQRVPQRRLSWAFSQAPWSLAGSVVPPRDRSRKGLNADAPPGSSGFLLHWSPRAASTNNTDWMPSKQQDPILWRFWKSEVQNAGGVRVGSCWSLRQSPSHGSLSASGVCWWPSTVLGL